jgi:hypothetical protein
VVPKLQDEAAVSRREEAQLIARQAEAVRAASDASLERSSGALLVLIEVGVVGVGVVGVGVVPKI